MKHHDILASLSSLALLTLSGCEIDTSEPIKIEKATSMAIQNAGNLELVLVRFTWQGNQGVLLWKSEPGDQLRTNETAPCNPFRGTNCTLTP